MFNLTVLLNVLSCTCLVHKTRYEFVLCMCLVGTQKGQDVVVFLMAISFRAIIPACKELGLFVFLTWDLDL